MASGNALWKRFGWAAIGIVVAAFLTLVGVRLFVGWFFVIPQNGMYPGLPAGSRVFSIKQPYADASQIVRGDVVLFEREEAGQRYVYIWRVVGLPGEILIVDGNKLLVNGEEFLRERVRSENGLEIYRESYGGAVYEVAYGPQLPPNIPKSVDLIVPRDHVFVMGDNRHSAVDSRTFGAIPFSSIVGKKW